MGSNSLQGFVENNFRTEEDIALLEEYVSRNLFFNGNMLPRLVLNKIKYGEAKSPNDGRKGEYEGPTGIVHPEFFGPDDFEVGKKYRIGRVGSRNPNKTDWVEGVVTNTDVVVTITGARALEMECLEDWKGVQRVVRRRYSFYKMKEVYLIEDAKSNQ